MVRCMENMMERHDNTITKHNNMMKRHDNTITRHDNMMEGHENMMERHMFLGALHSSTLSMGGWMRGGGGSEFGIQ